MYVPAKTASVLAVSPSKPKSDSRGSCRKGELAYCLYLSSSIDLEEYFFDGLFGGTLCDSFDAIGYNGFQHTLNPTALKFLGHCLAHSGLMSLLLHT
jgi:hypothetical protein